MKSENEIVEKIIELTEIKENFAIQFKNEKSNNCEDKGLLQHLKEELDYATAQVQILTWLFENEKI